ncbi:MAG: TlpA family protein disulfide reductase [Solirubrobacterales bacterium]
MGDTAPEMTLPKLEGSGEGSLAGYRGHWVLVNFWASWCPPCREEAPALEEFQQQHGNAEFTILGIDSRDLSDDGKAFVHRYGTSSPQLRDGQGNAAHDYGTTGFPENFLIDPKGRLRLMWAGPVALDELNEEVVPLLHQRQNH